MNVDVQLFARARDLAGSGTVNVPLTGAATVGALREALTEQYTQLRPIAGSLRVAVNGVYAADGDEIPPAAEVACFPPVSGG